MSKASIPILARSERWWVVHKPPGLSVHESRYTGPQHTTLIARLRAETGVPRLHAVHRLDHATSGALLVALDAEAARLLSAQFEMRTVEKRYLAVVRGHPDAHFVVDAALRDARGRRLAARTRFTTRGRLTLPIPVGRYPEARYALVEASPETGRHHQIRRHAKHSGHPIVGDVNYGKGEHNRLFRMHFGIHRLLLHAFRLAFDDPGSGERITVEAPPEGEFAKAMALF